jgi:hypothetical protein
MPKPYTALPENQVTPEPRLEKRTRRRLSGTRRFRSASKSPCGS